MYNSISDAIKENPMSRLSLQTASNNNTVHNGFLWKIFLRYIIILLLYIFN